MDYRFEFHKKNYARNFLAVEKFFTLEENSGEKSGQGQSAMTVELSPIGN